MSDERDERAEHFKETSPPLDGEDALAIITLDLIIDDHERSRAIAERVNVFMTSSAFSRLIVQPMPQVGDAIEVEKNKRAVVNVVNDAKPPCVRMLGYCTADVPGTRYMTMPSLRPWVVKNAIRAERAYTYVSSRWWFMLLGFLAMVLCMLAVSCGLILATLSLIDAVGITTPLHPALGTSILLLVCGLSVFGVRKLADVADQRLSSLRDSWRYAICLFESDVYSSILCDLMVNHGLDPRDAVNVLSVINSEEVKK